jgi:hypothetical protein
VVYSPSGGTVFWGIVTNYVYDNYVKNDPPSQITVTTDGTLIKTGKYTVIVSSAVHSGTEHAKQNPAVQSGLAKTFAALDAPRTSKTLALPVQSATSRRKSRSHAPPFQIVSQRRVADQIPPI